MQKQQCLPVAFLDLKKAFDRVDHSRLILCLREAGVGGKAIQWITTLLRDRYIRVVDRGYAADWHKLEYGVPQGSVLAPLLFLIFINGAAKAVENACHGTAKLILYADDIAVHPVAGHLHHNPRTLHHYLQTALTALEGWARSARMEFNPVKSQVVVFGNPIARHIRDMRQWITRHPLRLSFNLEHVHKYEYLGVWLTANLSWAYHASEQLKRARHDAFIITRLLRPPTAPYVDAVRQLVSGFLIPRCTYALEHWTPPPKIARQLQEQMVRPIRRVLGLPPFTHTLGTLVEAGIPSFTALKELAVLRCVQRIRHQLRADHPAKQLMRFANRWTVFATATHSKWFGSRDRLTPLSKELLLKTAITRTQHEWRGDADHFSDAPLLHVIPEIDADTSHLRRETGRLAMLRSNLRARRAMTLHTRARFHIDRTDVRANCTHPNCIGTIAEDTVPHMLLECPRHSSARDTLSAEASALLRDATGVITLAFILGSRCHNGSRLSPDTHRSVLALTGRYIRSICSDRERDGLPLL